jgi:AraC-like DNA-binding protein
VICRPEVRTADTARPNVLRTSDPAHAEQIVAKTYLPNTLDLTSSSTALRMELTTLRLGRTTVGKLSYGRSARLITAEAENFHVNIPISGHTLSSTGRGRPVPIGVGQGGVFPPNAPAEIVWSAESSQLCLMVSGHVLETELEHLLGRSISLPLDLQFQMTLDGDLGRSWRAALQVVQHELNQPTDISTHPSIGCHLEGLLIDGLLLLQPHNYSQLITASSAPGSVNAIALAIELMEEMPCEPWTTVRLAQEVHLSVRALQEGFKRETGLPPIAHLRQVRLRHVRKQLLLAHRHATTVRAIATRFGFIHMGHFAATYRQTFGETPSTSLDREPF